MKRSKFRKYALLVTIHLESSHAAILYVPYKDSRCLNKVKCGLRVQSGESASVVKLLFESSGTSSVLNTSHVMKGQYFISSSFHLYNSYFSFPIFHPFIFSSVHPLFFHPNLSSLHPFIPYMLFSREKFHPAKVNSYIFFIRPILFI